MTFCKLIKPICTSCYLLLCYAVVFLPVPDYCSVHGSSCSILACFAWWILQAEDVLALSYANWKKQVILPRHFSIKNNIGLLIQVLNIEILNIYLTTELQQTCKINISVSELQCQVGIRILSYSQANLTKENFFLNAEQRITGWRYS